NGDGKPDLAVLDKSDGTSDGTVWVYLNTTAPGASTVSFAPPQGFDVRASPVSMAVGDFNGDGKLDLAVVHIDNAGGVLTLPANTTAPGAMVLSFSQALVALDDPHPSSVAVADFNGDGKPDLVVTSGLSNTVSVNLNKTPPGVMIPSFAVQVSFATGTRPTSVAVADFNGDRKLDLVVVNSLSNTVSVLLNTTAPGATVPSFAPQTNFAVANPSSV